MKRFLLAIVVVTVVLLGLVLPAHAQEPQTPDEICAANPPITPATREFAQAEQVLEAGVNYQAIFCTAAGAVYVDLFEDETPLTVNNFVFLAQQGYYDNSVFHRVIADFMVQGGDPVGNPPGTGGPGYQFEDEFVGFLTFDKVGYLAMANAGPATNGSQFFITTAATTWLDYKHTIFGQVLEGQAVAEAIPDNQTDPTLLTALNKVVIVTDPSTIASIYESPVPAVRADVEAKFGEFATTIPATWAALVGDPQFATLLGYDASQTFFGTTEEWIALASEGVDAALLEDYYGSYTHEYHAIGAVTNTACDVTTFPVGALNFSLDAYATAEDAAAAARDPRLGEIFASLGFEPMEPALGIATFITRVPVCEMEMVVVRDVKQYGRFVVVEDVAFVEGTIAPPEQNSEVASFIISDLIGRLFEAPLQAIFMAEIQ